MRADETRTAIASAHAVFPQVLEDEGRGGGVKGAERGGRTRGIRG